MTNKEANPSHFTFMLTRSCPIIFMHSHIYTLAFILLHIHIVTLLVVEHAVYRFTEHRWSVSIFSLYVSQMYKLFLLTLRPTYFLFILTLMQGRTVVYVLFTDYTTWCMYLFTATVLDFLLAYCVSRLTRKAFSVICFAILSHDCNLV